LLARLRNRAQASNVTAQRLQQRLAFERFLARLAASDEWMLKGGFALELRYGWSARPTRDIDLRAAGDLDAAFVLLRTIIMEAPAAADHLNFELSAEARELQGAPGGTLRIGVHARLAGESFARFHLDLSCGDAVAVAPDLVEGSDLLQFAGVEPLRFPVYPVPQHLAEKLHAYTLPRAEPNTRVKDLVDMVTIAALEAIDGTALLACIQATFAARASHDVPAVLPEPPSAWAVPYGRLAAQAPMNRQTDLPSGFALATLLWQPVFDGVVPGHRWDPRHSAWFAQNSSAP